MSGFAWWVTATEKEVADALKAARADCCEEPDYTTRDKEDPTAEERFEAHTGTWEFHELHHTDH